jgi:hypothetical protein
MNTIKLYCALFSFFAFSFLFGAEKDNSEMLKYFADDMSLRSSDTMLCIRIIKNEAINKRNKCYNRKDAKIWINGFYDIPKKLTFYYYFKKGMNYILFDFSHSPFISNLVDGDKIKITFEGYSGYSRKIYKKHEFTYKKGQSKYIWSFVIKKLSFEPHWLKAKEFVRLSKKDKNDIKKLVNKLINVYKNENIDEFAEFLDSINYYQKLDTITSTGTLPKKLFFNKSKNLKFIYHAMFNGKNRRGFKCAKDFDITLNKENKRVINVFPKDSDMIYKVESKISFIENDDGSPKYITVGASGLNFIYLNDKWQIY